MNECMRKKERVNECIRKKEKERGKERRSEGVSKMFKQYF